MYSMLLVGNVIFSRKLHDSIDFTDLGVKNIIVATSSSILFFSQILVFFQDYIVPDSRL